MFVLIVSVAYGRQLSMEEALQKANSFYHEKSGTLKITSPRAAQLRLAHRHTDSSDNCDIYVFNRGENDGFVIVSGDDRAVPVLGYSDTGSFDADNIPANMQAWLEDYSRQIEWLRTNGVAVYEAEATEDYAPVAPLIASKWSQSEPYYNDCPEYKGDKCVTGCAATAMAMVMKYYNYPTSGTGSHTYTPANNRRLGQLSADFGNTTYDWENMLDEYNYGEYSDTEAQAVATLMYHCGVSLDMQYDPYASGAHSVDWMVALKTYFGYDDGIYLVNREYYSTEGWNKLIYDEIAAGRPVLYSGMSRQGGHAFICDGYSDDGYFHINWGWAGMSDGYFLFSALDPYEQGIGGGDGAFNYMQDVTLGIMPEDGEADNDYPRMFVMGDMVYDSTEDDIDWFTFINDPNGSNGIGNLSGETTNVELGFEIVDVVSGDNSIVLYESDEFAPMTGFGAIGIDFSDLDLPDGDYKIYLICRYEGSETIAPIPVPYRYQGYLNLNISDGVRTYTNIGIKHYDLEIGSLKIPELYTGLPVEMEIVINNLGDCIAYENVRVTMCPYDDAPIGKPIELGSDYMAIAPNSQGSINLSFYNFPLAPGLYELRLFDSMGNSFTFTKLLTVREGANLDISFPEYSEVVFADRKFSLNCTMKNIGGYNFNAPVFVQIRDTKTGETVNSQYIKAYIIAPEEEVSFEMGCTSSALVAGEDYEFVVSALYDFLYYDLCEPVSFTVSDETNAIETVSADDVVVYGLQGKIVAPEDARIYNLSGVETGKENLPAGIYLVKINEKTVKVVVK